VLIAPHFPLLEDWARANHVTFSSRQELVTHPTVRALYEGIVADLNQGLARFEKLKKVIVVPDQFSPEDGTLTASMKLRRRVVEARYRDQIEDLYAHAESVVHQD
jgi:long-chain acyl-CoA synthetase